MKANEIKALLGEVLPAVDFDADFLFSELDSLNVATILYVLSQKYDILLDSDDVTPKNLRNVESITNMVRAKMRLENKIYQYAVSTPEKIAVMSEGSTLTYSQLWDAVKARAEELSAEGLKPGRPYVWRASQDAKFIVNYCAVHYLKAVAVPLGAQTPDAVFDDIVNEVNASEFPTEIEDTLFTTGTTGKSKGVMLSETCLISCAENFICGMGFNKDLMFIVSGPLNHIASLFKIHPTLSAGGTLYILDGLKDMNAFFRVFDLPFKEFGTFLVPASIRLIMQFSYEKLCSLASRIAFIETGAAPITKTDMERLSKALPDSRLYNTYGGTEIGCVATYDFNDGKYMEGCVGRTLKNASVEVNEEGVVIVSGDTIMSGYLNDEESTNSVIRGGKIYLSDLGHFDGNGFLHLTGRQGDVINVGGYKVNPLEVENAASSFPGVKDCICIAATHPVIGPVLKLLVQVEGADQFDNHALAVHIKSKIESHKVPVMYEVVPSIKYTYNGKKDRKAYKQL